MKKFRRWLRQWLKCRAKRCDYYRHYLAYGPPDLTHEGFHAAEVQCEQVQRRYIQWLDDHKDQPHLEVPRELDRLAAFWEKQVRA